MEKFIRKSTWVGLVVTICVMLLGIALGAIILNRGLLDRQSQNLYLTVLCGAASLLGGMIAAKGKGQHLVRALIPAALFYLLLWILTFTADGVPVFDGYALRMGASILLGAAVGSLLVPRKERTHQTAKKRKPVNKKGKHTVT